MKHCSVPIDKSVLHRPIPRILLCAVLLCTLTACSSGHQPDLDASLRRITRKQRFSIAVWEIEQLLPDGSLPGLDEILGKAPESDAALVRIYAERVSRLNRIERRLERESAGASNAESSTLNELREERDTLTDQVQALRPHVQRILGRQVRDTYRAQGIYNPLDRWLRVPVSFPPLAFTLEPLPNLLIVSPRDHIESTREVLLDPEMTVEEMEAIEARVEALGYSALVERIGGLGATYPAFVQETGDVSWTAGTVAEEWMHQYLAFTPVGWRYVLDLLQVRPNYEIARINEGAVTIIQDEIGQAVMLTYYPPDASAEEATAADTEQAQDSGDDFVFQQEMRLTRLHVDELLAAGQIDEAEAYMEQRRLVFVEHGYALRKLNQAYFAFHGTYAVPSVEEPLPPELVDPLGTKLQALRAQSDSLAEFVDAVAAFRSAADLDAALEH